MRPAPADLEQRVAEALGRECLVAEGDRVGIAFSGGPDSTALLAAIGRMRPDLTVVALHVHHGQAHSEDASSAAADVAEALSVPFVTRRVDVGGGGAGGWESAAREARWDALRFLRRACSLSTIATGHTRDDRAETLLLNLLRGSGLDGLSAMRPRQGDVIRPLLDCSRAETTGYCRNRGLRPFEDPTNRETDARRNWVRAEVLPLLEAIHPGAARRIAQTADRLDADRVALDGLTTRAWEDAGRLVERGRGWLAFDHDSLLGLPRAVAVRVVRRSLSTLLGGWPPPADAAQSVLLGNGGQLRGTRLDSRWEGSMLVVRSPEDVVLDGGISIDRPGHTSWNGLDIEVRRLGRALELRRLRRGDRIEAGGRTVLEELSRKGVARRYRDQAIAVTDSRGRVLGVAGVGLPVLDHPEVALSVVLSQHDDAYVAEAPNPPGLPAGAAMDPAGDGARDPARE